MPHRPDPSSAPVLPQDEAQQQEAALPPEVERLARFTDGPGSPAEEQQPRGLLSLWRYQGLGL